MKYCAVNVLSTSKPNLKMKFLFPWQYYVYVAVVYEDNEMQVGS